MHSIKGINPTRSMHLTTRVYSFGNFYSGQFTVSMGTSLFPLTITQMQLSTSNLYRHGPILDGLFIPPTTIIQMQLSAPNVAFKIKFVQACPYLDGHFISPVTITHFSFQHQMCLLTSNLYRHVLILMHFSGLLLLPSPRHNFQHQICMDMLLFWWSFHSSNYHYRNAAFSTKCAF